MILLDENIIGDEREKLKKWKRSIRHIGFDISPKALQDFEIIPFLLRLKQPTFLTRDSDFYKRHLCHNRYCLVWLVVTAIQVAEYARRFLQHKEFGTNTMRLGKAVHVSVSGIAYWNAKSSLKHFARWRRGRKAEWFSFSEGKCR